MADNSFVSIFGSGGGGGSAPASCCWIVQCGTGVTSTNRICATNVASGCFSTTFGTKNTSSGDYGVVSGGQGNFASGLTSVVSGGSVNSASGSYSTIGGGFFNVSSGCQSTISGGYANVGSGIQSTISGGTFNRVQAFGGFIGGGNCNSVCNSTSGCLAYGAVVGGGVGNNTTGGTWSLASCCFTANPTICNAGQYSFVGGGFQNQALGFRSANVGGVKNSNNAVDGFIGSGNCNATCNSTSGCCAYGAVVVGGVGNNTTGGTWSLASCCFSVAPTICNTGQYSFVGGGFQNMAKVFNSSIVGGTNNCVNGAYGFIGGGLNNKVFGSVSSILGGNTNTACPSYVTIGGGLSNAVNNIYSDFSTIAGGQSNTIQGNDAGACGTTSIWHSFIGGGIYNTICQFVSNLCSTNFLTHTIGGGYSNIAGFTTGSGYYDDTFPSTIGGGYCNKSIAIGSFVGGGRTNSACGAYSVVSGGLGNDSRGTFSSIVGGSSITASSYGIFVGGGGQHIISGSYAVLGGGCVNVLSGSFSTILGGFCNTTSGLRSSIVSGFKNLNNSIDGFIGGGNCNFACNTTSGCLSYGAVVVGGVGNNTTGGTWTLASCAFSVAPTICTAGQYSFVGGGIQNTATSCFSVSVGGRTNRAGGDGNNVIVGGCNNTTSAYLTGILGGCGNVACCNRSFVIGDAITTDRICTTFVNNLSIKTIPTSAPAQSGAVWRCTADNTLRIVP